MISGVVGSGKTALMHEFADRTVDAGALFLVAAAARSERTLPLGVLCQLFRSAKPSAAKSERAARLMDDSLLKALLSESESESGTAGHVPAPVLSELSDIILDLAEQRPLVIAIDDIHHADVSSLEGVLYLVRRMRSFRIFIMLSKCALPLEAHPLIHAELIHQPHFRNIRLAPLSRHGVSRVLAEDLDLATAESLAPACYTVTGGNPLLVHALIEDYRTYPKNSPAHLVFGDAFGQAALTCLHRTGSGALSVARGIAVLGEPASSVLLGELLDMDAKSIGQIIKMLNAVGLIDANRFRHEAARAAVLDGLTPAERAALHGRAAHVLHQHGTAFSVLASHLAAADRIDVPWAMQVLREAAEQALTEDDVGLAIGYLRQAHQACSDDQQRAVIISLLARAEWRVDPVAAVRHLPELTTAVREGRLTGRDAVMLINYLLWHERPGEAASVIEQLAQAPLTAKVAADLDNARLWAAFMYPGPLGHLRSVQVPAADRKLSPEVLPSQLTAASVLIAALTRGADENTAAQAEQILQGSPLDDLTLLPIGVVLEALIYADEPAKAGSWCHRFLMDAGARRIPAWQALFAAIQAAADLRQGNLGAAENHAHAALTFIIPKSWGVFIGLPLASLIIATTEAGKYEDAATCLRIPVPEAMFKTPYGLYYLRARGRYYHATGRPYAALADFQLCGHLMTRWGLDLPGLVPWRTDAAQAYLDIGKAAEARKLAQDQLTRLAPGHIRVRGISLRVLAATREIRDQPSLLRTAIDALQKCDDRLELALALADLGEAHYALGDYARAHLMHYKAYHLAEQCGIEPLRRSLLSRADSTGLDSLADDAADADLTTGLSDAERRVARLAAHGYTNRQIASKLYVTVSTVEQHLTRVYRKLNVKRRADLPLELQTGFRPVQLGSSHVTRERRSSL